MFAKETNDSAASALIDALLAHEGVLLRNDTPVDENLSKLMASGLTDKRSKIKAAWAVAISGVIWGVSIVNPASIAFSKTIAKNLFVVFSEIASNAVQASQTGTITAGYAISAATLGRWLDWQDPHLGISTKRSSDSRSTCEI